MATPRASMHANPSGVCAAAMNRFAAPIDILNDA